MQIQNGDEHTDLEPSKPQDTPTRTSPPPAEPTPDDVDTDTTNIDIYGKTMELSLFNEAVSDTADADGLYIYKNVFNLLPKSLGSLGTRLKTLKFFANEINLFPAEFEDCLDLQCLQVKVASLGLVGLPMSKLKALKELELSKAPSRLSGFPILTQISALSSLTKLSVCHFSIRYLPPEISCLSNLECLDLSFNKMRSLPKEIGSLSALISLKVANNKLIELPPTLSSLEKLENLDLSRNRLRSLGLLDLNMMQNLKKLNLEYNKLLTCEIPSWICCDLEGKGTEVCCDELVGSAVEMDVLEATIDNRSISCDASSSSSAYHLLGSSVSDRCFLKRRLGKRWKRRQYLQQRARLNNSKKWKFDNHGEILTIKSGGRCGTCKQGFRASNMPSGCASDITSVEDQAKESMGGNDGTANCLLVDEDGDVKSEKGTQLKNCSCAVSGVDCDEIGNYHEFSGVSRDPLICTPEFDDKKSNKRSSFQASKSPQKCKRQPDRLLDNPKPRKSRRSADGHPGVSHKYNRKSFCGVEDLLPDGFYDAGRDRPFMPLGEYEQNLDLHSREVILLDRGRDEELGAISLSAQQMVFRFMKLTGSKRRRDATPNDDLLVASWLALFVSDRFGGSDRSSFLEKARKDVSGSNYHKPFICTCATGNSQSRIDARKSVRITDDIEMQNLCEKSLQTIKLRHNSVVVPIGSLQLGVCRHRAVLMKYLCDRMDPPVPCELIRGYLDFFPHAWNAVLIQRDGSWVRMIVDSCRPQDIREETDPEYFCRYIPLSRITSPVLLLSNTPYTSCFPTISECEEVEKVASCSVIVCKVGSVEGAAKVRTLKLAATSLDEIRKFEMTCLGEVRMLSALRNHSCIVDVYGHKISSKWIAASDKIPEQRFLRSIILMEYVRGGSLKDYIEKLLKAGKTHVPVHLAFCIARDVASALKELHSKHIIHRDVKSENVLIDLEQKRADGSPIVKLSDFDSAIPLRAPSHTCCISHLGMPPPDVCVGTPRWMAPEVLRTMKEHKTYGLEIDIWSYGCLLFELLTLQVPYKGLPDSNIHELLENGKRPPITKELEQLSLLEESPKSKASEKPRETENDLEGLRFLLDIFNRCTNGNPAERPTAEDLHKMLLAKSSSSFELAELDSV